MQKVIPNRFNFINSDGNTYEAVLKGNRYFVRVYLLGRFEDVTFEINVVRRLINNGNWIILNEVNNNVDRQCV